MREAILVYSNAGLNDRRLPGGLRFHEMYMRAADFARPLLELFFARSSFNTAVLAISLICAKPSDARCNMDARFIRSGIFDSREQRVLLMHFV
jgi:hypothetical protein